MDFIEWNEKYSVKVSLIDEQHKHLFRIVNNFYEKFKNKSPEDEVANIISELQGYARMHFATEELYLKRYGLGQYDSHKIEHDSFMKEVDSMADKYKQGKIVLTIDIMKFVRNWITNHVLGTDMKYSAIFANNGIK